MRGFKSKDSANTLVQGFNNYYNFIRPHTNLGMTPAEASGINLNLVGNRWLRLVKKLNGK